MNALLLGIDGFGPVHGWLAFLVIMAAVIIGGGLLGYAGRMADGRKRGNTTR